MTALPPLPPRPAFLDDGPAACADSSMVHPDVFFPEVNSRTAAGRSTLAVAQAICRGCELRDACLAYAVEHRLEHGVWGGKTLVERKRLRRRGAA